MPKGTYLFTSESVSEGHPDKVSDRISDAVVDLYLGADPSSRVACETLTTTNRIVLAGEVRGPESITKEMIEGVARDAVKDIGYEQDGFHWKNAEVEVHLHQQSVDIAQGVDSAGNKDEGAGRHADANSGLGPDSKSQVTLQYENGKPVGATSIVVSTQHAEEMDQDQIREIVRPHVEGILPAGWMCPEEEFYVNPTGRFVIGGPDGDCGLTGRKIIVDTYGGAAPHGGGAFSGKDPSKVDRSAAYAARWVAKNVVAAGMAEKCVIQLAYAIGVAKPLSVYVDTAGTATMDEDKLADVIQEVVDLSPRGIREGLQLSRPIYARSAAYGHFGRTPDADGGFSWENTDLVDALKAAASS